MATSVGNIFDGRSGAGALGRFADRWIFAFMAALFLGVVLLGFIPDSIGLLGAVRAGQHLPLPPILHVHAVLMGSWLLLLLTQAILVGSGRTAVHRRLGLLSVILVPAMVVAGFLLVKTDLRAFGLLYAAPGATAQLKAQVKEVGPPLVFDQIRMGFLFFVLVSWALLLRVKDPQAHKRLMILATVVPLAAGTDRALALLGWPQHFGPPNFYLDVYSLLLLLPLFAYDLLRRRRLPVHRAYIIWGGLFVPTGLAMYMLAGSSWWIGIFPSLLGLKHW